MSDAPQPSEATTPPFAIVRRGYDPVAVDEFVAQMRHEQQALSSSEAEVRAKAGEIVREAQRRAAEVLQHAEDALASAVEDQARAENLAQAAELERAELAEQAARAAEEMIGGARARAESIIAAAEAMDAEAQVNRWADVGDRVGRLLGAAEEEAKGIVADAAAAADRLQAETVAEADRARREADRYAEETRALADEWANARVAAADADQAKAADVLDSARTRAGRILTEAEAEAQLVHERAHAEVTAHVQGLLASARYDLDQLEGRADAARVHLQELRDLATRSLEGEDDRPSSSLGAPEAFLHSGQRSSDGDRDGGASGDGGPDLRDHVDALGVPDFVGPRGDHEVTT